MCVTWIRVCCGHLCSSIISVDSFMAVDIGSLAATNIVSPLSGWMASHVGMESVIVKFTRLEAKAAMAKNNEMEARAMIASLLHRERVAKCSAEKARVSLRMANAQACKYQIALLMSWLAFVVLFIFSLGDYGKCVCHDFEFGLVVCVMKFYHVVGHENVL